MAQIKTLTIGSVNQILPDLHYITMNLLIEDDSTTPAITLFNKDFGIRYRAGESISDKETALQIKIQKGIDKWKVEENIKNSAVLENVRTNIESNLTL